MNTDQIQSIIRNILVGLGSSGTVFGLAIDNSTWITIASGLAAVVGVVWGVIFHAGPTKADAVAVAGGTAKIAAVVGS